MATTEDIQSLVVRAKTIGETLEIARDVAQKLIESQTDINLNPIAESFDYPLAIGQ